MDILTIIYFIIGSLLIIKGADWFVNSAVSISTKCKIPQIIIGSTIVSFATTSPELTVSTTAAYAGHVGISVGNAVGSAICNIALILATSMIIRPIIITDTKSFLNGTLFMLGAGIALVGFSIDGIVTGFEGVILLLIFIGFLYYSYRVQVSSFKENEKSSSTIKENLSIKNRFQGISKDILLFILGAGAVVIGSTTLVSSGIKIAEWLGVPDLIIGLTMIAIGTSLPEYVTAVSAAIKRHQDISLGNIIGANIANCTYIIAFSSFLASLTIDTQFFEYDFIIMIGIFALLLIFGTTKNILSRKEGLAFLIIYVAYVIGLVVFYS